MTIQQGIHSNIPISVYIGDPAPAPSLSTRVAAALLNECPASAWFNHPRLNPGLEGEDTTATDVGKIVHAVLLEGDESQLEIVEASDWRTKAAKEQRDLARANGKIPILTDKWPIIKDLVEAAKQNYKKLEGRIGFPLSDMLVEKTLIWQEGEVWCRSRPDLLTPDYSLAIDFKTTEVSVHPDSFGRQISNMDYDMQAALMRAGVYALTGKTPDVVFWAQQVSAPFLSSFVGLDPTFAAIADRKLAIAVARWRECIQKDEWPGYPADICWVQPPPWEIAKWESEEIPETSVEFVEKLKRYAP